MTGAIRTLMRLAGRSVILAAIGLACCAVHAQGTQTFPWGYSIPQDIAAVPRGDASVKFNSTQDGSPDLAIPGVLFKPTASAKGAVVIVNAPGGWTDAREGHYGRSLSSAGYAVLAIDTYGPRGVTSTLADNTKPTTHAQLRDAFAARKYLVSLGYPADRIAIMGTGRAGTIALLAADLTLVQNEEERFALAIAISPGCVFHPRAPKPGAHIFMAIAEKDDVTGVQPCQGLASEYAAAGGKVAVKVYPDASHGFDGHPKTIWMTRDPVVESIALCSVPIEADGRFSFNGKSFAENDSGALFAEMRKSCIRRGGSGWTNVTQKANVTLDVIKFLDANFRH